MEIVFLHSFYLYFLFAIPAMIAIHFFSLKFRKTYALKFANFESIARIKGVDLYSKNISVLVISCLIIIFIVFSLAGATIKYSGQVSSFSFVLALDSSRSMEAQDFLPNRMEAAKETAQGFVDLTPQGTKSAVISFSGNSIIEQRITDDKILLKEAISRINITLIGGTDLYDAIVASSNLLSGEENKAIILLSDGQTNVGDVTSAIDYALKNDVIVQTIGIGTIEGSNASFGLSRLDEDSLKAIAFNTKGNYFNAGDKETLGESFNSILQLKNGIVSYDISKYLLFAAILLFFIEYVLINTRFRMFP